MSLPRGREGASGGGYSSRRDGRGVANALGGMNVTTTSTAINSSNHSTGSNSMIGGGAKPQVSPFRRFRSGGGGAGMGSRGNWHSSHSTYPGQRGGGGEDGVVVGGRSVARRGVNHLHYSTSNSTSSGGGGDDHYDAGRGKGRGGRERGERGRGVRGGRGTGSHYGGTPKGVGPHPATFLFDHSDKQRTDNVGEDGGVEHRVGDPTAFSFLPSPLTTTATSGTTPVQCAANAAIMTVGQLPSPLSLLLAFTTTSVGKEVCDSLTTDLQEKVLLRGNLRRLGGGSSGGGGSTGMGVGLSSGGSTLSHTCIDMSIAADPIEQFFYPAWTPKSLIVSSPLSSLPYGMRRITTNSSFGSVFPSESTVGAADQTNSAASSFPSSLNPISATDMDGGTTSRMIIIPVERYRRAAAGKVLSSNDLRTVQTLEKSMHFLVEHYLRDPNRQHQPSSSTASAAAEICEDIAQKMRIASIPSSSAAAAVLVEEIPRLYTNTSLLWREPDKLWAFLWDRFRGIRASWIPQLPPVGDYMPLGDASKSTEGAAPCRKDPPPCASPVTYRDDGTKEVLCTAMLQKENKRRVRWLEFMVAALYIGAASICRTVEGCQSFLIQKKNVLESISQCFTDLAVWYRTQKGRYRHAELFSVLLLIYGLKQELKVEDRSFFCEFIKKQLQTTGEGGKAVGSDGMEDHPDNFVFCVEPPSESLNLSQVYQELERQPQLIRTTAVRSVLRLLHCWGNRSYFEFLALCREGRQRGGTTYEEEEQEEQQQQRGEEEEEEEEKGEGKEERGPREGRVRGRGGEAGTLSWEASVYEGKHSVGKARANGERTREGKIRKERKEWATQACASSFYLTPLQRAVLFQSFAYARFRAVLELLQPNYYDVYHGLRIRDFIPISTLSYLLLMEESHCLRFLEVLGVCHLLERRESVPPTSLIPSPPSRTPYPSSIQRNTQVLVLRLCDEKQKPLISSTELMEKCTNKAGLFLPTYSDYFSFLPWHTTAGISSLGPLFHAPGRRGCTSPSASIHIHDRGDASPQSSTGGPQGWKEGKERDGALTSERATGRALWIVAPQPLQGQHHPCRVESREGDSFYGDVRRGKSSSVNGIVMDEDSETKLLHDPHYPVDWMALLEPYCPPYTSELAQYSLEDVEEGPWFSSIPQHRREALRRYVRQHHRECPSYYLSSRSSSFSGSTDEGDEGDEGGEWEMSREKRKKRWTSTELEEWDNESLATRKSVFEDSEWLMPEWSDEGEEEETAVAAEDTSASHKVDNGDVQGGEEKEEEREGSGGRASSDGQDAFQVRWRAVQGKWSAVQKWMISLKEDPIYHEEDEDSELGPGGFGAVSHSFAIPSSRNPAGSFDEGTQDGHSPIISSRGSSGAAQNKKGKIGEGVPDEEEEQSALPGSLPSTIIATPMTMNTASVCPGVAHNALPPTGGGTVTTIKPFSSLSSPPLPPYTTTTAELPASHPFPPTPSFSDTSSLPSASTEKGETEESSLTGFPATKVTTSSEYILRLPSPPPPSPPLPPSSVQEPSTTEVYSPPLSPCLRSPSVKAEVAIPLARGAPTAYKGETSKRFLPLSLDKQQTESATTSGETVTKAVDEAEAGGTKRRVEAAQKSFLPTPLPPSSSFSSPYSSSTTLDTGRPGGSIKGETEKEEKIEEEERKRKRERKRGRGALEDGSDPTGTFTTSSTSSFPFPLSPILGTFTILRTLRSRIQYDLNQLWKIDNASRQRKNLMNSRRESNKGESGSHHHRRFASSSFMHKDEVCVNHREIGEKEKRDDNEESEEEDRTKKKKEEEELKRNVAVAVSSYQHLLRSRLHAKMKNKRNDATDNVDGVDGGSGEYFQENDPDVFSCDGRIGKMGMREWWKYSSVMRDVEQQKEAQETTSFSRVSSFFLSSSSCSRKQQRRKVMMRRTDTQTDQRSGGWHWLEPMSKCQRSCFFHKLHHTLACIAREKMETLMLSADPSACSCSSQKEMFRQLSPFFSCAPLGVETASPPQSLEHLQEETSSDHFSFSSCSSSSAFGITPSFHVSFPLLLWLPPCEGEHSWCCSSSLTSSRDHECQDENKTRKHFEKKCLKGADRVMIQDEEGTCRGSKKLELRVMEKIQKVLRKLLYSSASDSDDEEEEEEEDVEVAKQTIGNYPINLNEDEEVLETAEIICLPSSPPFSSSFAYPLHHQPFPDFFFLCSSLVSVVNKQHHGVFGSSIMSRSSESVPAPISSSSPSLCPPSGVAEAGGCIAILVLQHPSCFSEETYSGKDASTPQFSARIMTMMEQKMGNEAKEGSWANCCALLRAAASTALHRARACSLTQPPAATASPPWLTTAPSTPPRFATPIKGILVLTLPDLSKNRPSMPSSSLSAVPPAKSIPRYIKERIRNQWGRCVIDLARDMCKDYAKVTFQRERRSTFPPLTTTGSANNNNNNNTTLRLPRYRPIDMRFLSSFPLECGSTPTDAVGGGGGGFLHHNREGIPNKTESYLHKESKTKRRERVNTKEHFLFSKEKRLGETSIVLTPCVYDPKGTQDSEAIQWRKAADEWMPVISVECLSEDEQWPFSSLVSPDNSFLTVQKVSSAVERGLKTLLESC